MKPQHILVAILVAAIWGFNFMTVKVGLSEMPPFLYVCARFAIGLPLLFFIKKPPVPWSIIIGIGVTLGIAKFALMFWGVHVGMSVGLGSLILQSQAFFTAILSVLWLGDKLRSNQIIGMMIAFCGIAVIGVNLHEGCTLAGFILIIAAAIAWAFSNILVKFAGNVNMFSLVVWTGLIPPLPMYLLSFAVEGPQALSYLLFEMSSLGWACLLFTTCASTWLGSTLWGILLRTYDVSRVAPYSLLIPIFGMTFGHVFLGEQFTPLTYVACGLVFLGLVINQWTILPKRPSTVLSIPSNAGTLAKEAA